MSKNNSFLESSLLNDDQGSQVTTTPRTVLSTVKNFFIQRLTLEDIRDPSRRRFVGLGVLGLASIMGIGNSVTEAKNPGSTNLESELPPVYALRNKPDLIVVHRASSLYVGNSIKDIEEGLRMGVDGFELDIRPVRSENGQKEWVLFHDDILSQFGSHGDYPGNFTKRELEDILYENLPPTLPRKPNDLPLATLKDALRLAIKHNKLIILDFKSYNRDDIADITDFFDTDIENLFPNEFTGQNKGNNLWAYVCGTSKEGILQHPRYMPLVGYVFKSVTYGHDHNLEKIEQIVAETRALPNKVIWMPDCILALAKALGTLETYPNLVEIHYPEIPKYDNKSYLPDIKVGSSTIETFQDTIETLLFDLQRLGIDWDKVYEPGSNEEYQRHKSINQRAETIWRIHCLTTTEKHHSQAVIEALIGVVKTRSLSPYWSHVGLDGAQAVTELGYQVKAQNPYITVSDLIQLLKEQVLNRPTEPDLHKCYRYMESYEDAVRKLAADEELSPVEFPSESYADWRMQAKAFAVLLELIDPISDIHNRPQTYDEIFEFAYEYLDLPESEIDRIGFNRYETATMVALYAKPTKETLEYLLDHQQSEIHSFALNEVIRIILSKKYDLSIRRSLYDCLIERGRTYITDKITRP